MAEVLGHVPWFTPLVYTGKLFFYSGCRGGELRLKDDCLQPPTKIHSINSVKIIQTSLVTKTDLLPPARLCLLREPCTAPWLDMNSNKVCLKIWWYSKCNCAKLAILILTNLFLLTPQRPTGLLRKAFFFWFFKHLLLRTKQVREFSYSHSPILWFYLKEAIVYLYPRILWNCPNTHACRSPHRNSIHSNEA